MPILLSCSCGQQIQVREEFAGQQAQCPNCQGFFVIPHPSGKGKARPKPSQPARRPHDDEPASRGGSGMALLLLGLFLALVTGTGAALWYFSQNTDKPKPTETPLVKGDTKDKPKPTDPPPPKPTPGEKPTPPKPTPTPSPTPTKSGPWSGHTSPVYQVGFDRAGDVALSAGGGFVEKDGQLAIAGDNTIRRWNVSTGREIDKLEGFDDGISVAAFSTDGRWAAVVTLGADVGGNWKADADTSIHLWDLLLQREIRTFTGHGKPPFCLAFSPDGTRLLSGGPDMTIRLWDVGAGNEIKRLSGHRAAINSVAFSPDGTKAISGSGDRTARLWDLDKQSQILQFPAHGDIVWAVAFSPDGTKALSAGGNYYDVGKPGFVPGNRDYKIRLWDVAKGELIREFEGHEDAVVAFSFSKDSRRFLSASEDKTVRLWHIATGRMLKKFDDHPDKVRSVAFLPSEKQALSSDDSGALRIWKLPPDVSDFIAQLSSPDKTKQLEAIQELSQYGNEAVAAVPKLLGMIPTSTGSMQAELLAALNRIGKPSKEHAVLLAPMLLDKKFVTGRRYAMEQLTAMGADALPALDALHATLKDEDPTYRLRALEALGAIGPEAKKKALFDVVAMLADDQEVIRKTASESLKKFGPPEKGLLPNLLENLDHRSLSIRRYVVGVLKSFGPDAKPAYDKLLIRLASDSSPEVRVQIIEALMAIEPKGKRLIDELTVTMKLAEDGGLAVAATSALAKIDLSEGTLPSLLSALRDKREDISKIGADAIAAAPLTKEHLPKLLELLEVTESERVKLALLASIQRLGANAADAVPTLAKMLPDSEGTLQSLLLQILRGLGEKAAPAGAAMAKLLETDDPARKLEIAFALSEIAAPESDQAIPFLVDGLLIDNNKDEKQLERRKKVAQTLVNIGRPAVKPLIDALGRKFAGSTKTPEGLVKVEARLATLQILGVIGKKGKYPEIILALSRIEGRDPVEQLRKTAHKLRIALQK